MSAESVPVVTRNETAEVVSPVYDRETTFEQAEAEMEKMLSEIDVPEDLNPELSTAYRMQILYKTLDSVETDNSFRFVATVLNDARAQVLGELSSFKLRELNDYLYKNKMPSI